MIWAGPTGSPDLLRRVRRIVARVYSLNHHWLYTASVSWVSDRAYAELERTGSL